MAETKGKYDFKAILIALLLLQFACGTINNLFQPDSTSPENNDPTLTKEEPSPEPDTPTPIEEILPTQTPEPTPTHTATPTRPALEGKPGEKLLYFTDFISETKLSKDWSVFSDPSDLDYEFTINDSRVFVGIPDSRSVVLMINTASLEDGPADDVYIEAGFVNRSDHDVNNISLVCRFSEKGWYEFRLLRGGEWEIWKYSYDNGGYIRLDDDRLPRLTGDTPGTIGAKCWGDTLTFYFNGRAVPDATVTDTEITEGAVGMSVFTILWEQAAIEIDYFGLSEP